MGGRREEIGGWKEEMGRSSREDKEIESRKTQRGTEAFREETGKKRTEGDRRKRRSKTDE